MTVSTWYYNYKHKLDDIIMTSQLYSSSERTARRECAVWWSPPLRVGKFPGYSPTGMPEAYTEVTTSSGCVHHKWVCAWISLGPSCTCLSGHETAALPWGGCLSLSAHWVVLCHLALISYIPLESVRQLVMGVRSCYVATSHCSGGYYTQLVYWSSVCDHVYMYGCVLQCHLLHIH